MAKTPVTRPAIVGGFATRPRLVASIATGLVVGLALMLLTSLRASTATVIGWDAMCLTFSAVMLHYMKDSTAQEMRNHAADADEGRLTVLVLILLAAAASVGAIVMELVAAKSDKTTASGLYVALAFFTVAMSWYFVQLNFALHYAHAYYTRDEGRKADAGGLGFPGKDAPDYWDFLHFSIVIGVASQTADITFTEKGLRRLGTFHSLFAFVFNTVVVALTINLLASLF